MTTPGTGRAVPEPATLAAPLPVSRHTCRGGPPRAPTLDSAGVPHVAYWTPGTGIVIASRTGSDWTYETYPGPAAPASLPSDLRGPGSPAPARADLLITQTLDMALDPGDEPWIAHARLDCFGDCTGTLRVSHKVGASWTTEDIATVIARPSIEVEQDGATWNKLQVAGGSRSGNMPSIAIDPAGDPIIPFNDQTGLDLRRASRTNGSWTVATIDAEGNTPRCASTSWTPPGVPSRPGRRSTWAQARPRSGGMRG